MAKLENLLSFNDFEKNWDAKKQKSTKKTEVGLDVLQEKASIKQIEARKKFLDMINKKKNNKTVEDKFAKKGKKKFCKECGK
jgi:hypothetical protein